MRFAVTPVGATLLWTIFASLFFARLSLADSEMSPHNRDEIVSRMEELAAIGGNDPEAGWTHVKAGMLDLFRGNVEAATDHFETAVKLEPETSMAARAEFGLGISLLIMGDERSAAYAFRNAADQGQGGMVAYAELSYGRLMMNQGDYRTAESSFSRVVADYRNLGVADDAALGLAQSLREQGLYREAAEVLEDAREFEDNDRYKGADSERLRWDHLDEHSPEKVASFMQRAVLKAVLTGKSPVIAVLTAMTDADNTGELRRTRRGIEQDLNGWPVDQLTQAERVDGDVAIQPTATIHALDDSARTRSTASTLNTNARSLGEGPAERSDPPMLPSWLPGILTLGALFLAFAVFRWRRRV